MRCKRQHRRQKKSYIPLDHRLLSPPQQVFSQVFDIYTLFPGTMSICPSHISRADASNFLILSKLVPGSCGGDYVRRGRLLQGDLAAGIGVKAENVATDQQGDAPEWFRHEVLVI